MNNKKGLSREELLSAMALMDGELHSGLKHVEQSIVQPGPRREAAQATYVLGEFIRDWAEEKSEGFDVSDAIMARIAQEPRPQRTQAPVAQLAPPIQPVQMQAAPTHTPQNVVAFPVDRARAGTAQPTEKRQTGSGARVFAIGTAVASVFAAAAAAMVFLSHQTELKLDTSQAAMSRDLPTIDVQVQQVESSNSVSVFQVPSSLNANGTSVVIWIDDAVGVSP